MRRIVRRNATRATLALAMIVGVAACSVSPPVFVTADVRLVVVATDGSGARDERLSVFASVSDADGSADIEYLYVVCDEHELYWTLDADAWQRVDEGESVWLGSNGLDAPGYRIPRGEYRLILVDKAGERDERVCTLSAPGTEDYRLPDVRLDGTAVKLVSPYPSATAFFSDSGGNVVMSTPILSGTTSLDSLWPKGQWRSEADYLTVYGFEPEAETGFFSWKIRLPD
ncbi:MAG: hypothetical protein JXM71_04710 [Spirochaetales bacterium]|nr:hypothetical protein [Spirochaetales bacterium]